MIPVYNAFPTVLLMQRGTIIKKLTECGAFSEETAVTLEQAGVFKVFKKVFPYVLKTMEKKKTITQTKGGKYYLNK